MLVHWLAGEVHKARPYEHDRSPSWSNLHVKRSDQHAVQYTTSRLWATIAQKVRNPKGPRPPKPSDMYDVKAISTFAPYCDAMLVE